MTEPIPADLVTRTWSRPIERPDAIPDSADVVIIGGGIVGVSTAWFLARQGVRVALCEKGHIAGEQSGRNWGWVRQQGRDAREMPMIIESLNIWRGLAEAIGEDVDSSRPVASMPPGPTTNSKAMRRGCPPRGTMVSIRAWSPVARSHSSPPAPPARGLAGSTRQATVRPNPTRLPRRHADQTACCYAPCLECGRFAALAPNLPYPNA